MSGFPPTLWTVIRHAREGDEAARREFVARYRGLVVACGVRAGLGSEAEDLAQEVLLQCFQAGVLDQADPSRGRFRSLLLAVTRHWIGKRRRGERAARRGGGPPLPLDGLDLAAPVADPDFDREYVARLVAMALDRLAREHPAYHRAVAEFLLRGRSYAEIAARSGTPPGDLKNHVFRGKQKMVEYLRELVRDTVSSPEELREELGYLAQYFPP